MHTINYLKKTSNLSLELIRKKLYEVSVKTGYDEEFRIIAFPEYRGNNITNKIMRECNGLVLLYNSEGIKCLSIPMPYLRNSKQITRSSILSEWNDNTKIYECKEGSYITLYHYADRWCISTTRGIEVNETIWRTKTYQQMVLEAVQAIMPDYDWKSFTDSLNPEYSYCFGFYHPDMHVYGDSEVPNIWVNKITNLSTYETVDQTVGLLEKIVPVEMKKTKAEILDSLENAENLGYIISGLTGGDVLVESSLKESINDLYYDSAYTEDIKYTSYSRHNYVLIYNYMWARKHFMEIFPKYKKEYEKFDNLLDALIAKLEIIYRKFNKGQEFKQEGNLDKIAYEIKKNIDTLAEVNVDDKSFRPTIMGVIYHNRNFDALYRLFYNSTPLD